MHLAGLQRNICVSQVTGPISCHTLKALPPSSGHVNWPVDALVMVTETNLKDGMQVLRMNLAFRHAHQLVEESVILRIICFVVNFSN
nr:hypothetical protein Iba_chr12bCG9360 [Ipomoea batatas]